MAKAKLSKTQLALAYVAKGMSTKEAALKAGVADATVRSTLSRRKGRDVCPCCGQVVREGFAIKS